MKWFAMAAIALGVLAFNAFCAALIGLVGCSSPSSIPATSTVVSPPATAIPIDGRAPL